jgi:hypothetical protein
MHPRSVERALARQGKKGPMTCPHRNCIVAFTVDLALDAVGARDQHAVIEPRSGSDARDDASP